MRGINIECKACGKNYDVHVKKEGQEFTDFRIICCIFCGQQIKRRCNEPTKENRARQNISKKDELVQKVKAGHFNHFQDLFAEVTSPYSDFFGIDPYPIWEVAHGTN